MTETGDSNEITMPTVHDMPAYGAGLKLAVLNSLKEGRGSSSGLGELKMPGQAGEEPRGEQPRLFPAFLLATPFAVASLNAAELLLLRTAQPASGDRP